MKLQRTLLGLLAALCLIAASCGDDDGGGGDSTTSSSSSSIPLAEEASDGATSEEAEAGAFPVTIATDDGEVTIEARPEAIVSLSPSATEMLFAIGAGDQVVAVDEFSYYPEEAPVTDLSGFETNVEAVGEYSPDLIVASGPIEGIDVLGAPVIVQFAPADIEGSYAQIEQLGVATGHVGDAAELVGQMQADLRAAVASVPEFETPPTYFHEVGTEYYTATSATFAGSVYSLFGLENVADAADPDGEFAGYPQMTEEAIIDADPDLIFLADTIGYEQSAETVAARPGWESISAVENGNVIELNDDIASRWGPRIVEMVETIAAALAEIEEPANA